MPRTKSREIKAQKVEVRSAQKRASGERVRGNESGSLQGGGAAEHSHGGRIEGREKASGWESGCAVDSSAALEPVVRCRMGGAREEEGERRRGLL
jgi:hypothetical protein